MALLRLGHQVRSLFASSRPPALVYNTSIPLAITPPPNNNTTLISSSTHTYNYDMTTGVAAMGGDMPPLLSLPMKRSDSMQWSLALLRYIENAYAEDTAKYEPDAHALDELRQACCFSNDLQQPVEPTLAGLDQLFT